MEFKNTWTRIAARWNDEGQNKVNINTNAAEYCGSFEYNIMRLANHLTQINFVNDRVKKISDATFNIFETNGTYYVLNENGYDISDDTHDEEYFDTMPDNINELTETINNIQNEISSYDSNINTLIRDFKQDKNDKIQNYKIAKELEKFKNTINQFYQLLSKEYSNIEQFEPFYIIISKVYDEILNKNFYSADDEEDICQYKTQENARDNMLKLIQEINEETDEGVEKGSVILPDNNDGHLKEDDFEIIKINNQKEYNDILKKYNIKK